MMGEEDRNPEIIRKVNSELSNIRQEQRIMKLWGIVLLVTNLLMVSGSLLVLRQEAKPPVPEDTAFQYPPPAMPTEEDSSIWITEKISDDVSSTDNTSNAHPAENTDDTESIPADTAAVNMDEADEANYTDFTEEPPLQTESPVPPASAPVAVNQASARPVTTRPAVTRSATARTVKKAVRPARKKTAAIIPACVITRQVMTLRSLARQYYGNEVFWVYIYDRNRRVLSSLETSSFDALPSGIQLELPRPVDYGIDATEPISLQRACNQAKSLAIQ